jgi:WD40 repeat protein
LHDRRANAVAARCFQRTLDLIRNPLDPTSGVGCQAGSKSRRRRRHVLRGDPVPYGQDHLVAVQRLPRDETVEFAPRPMLREEVATEDDDPEPRSSKALIAFSPDGSRVVSAGNDGTVRVWTTTGGPDHDPVVLRGHQGLVWSVAFSPDGRSVASSGNDGTVRVWKITGARDPVVLHGHQGLVWSVAFSPDGRWVVSSSNDNTVRVWTTTGVSDPIVFRGSGASMEGVAFSPDGRRLAAARGDGTVRVWHCEVCGTIPQVLALAKKRVTRELTSEERKIFLHRLRGP